MENDSSEVLILSRCEMVQPLMDALVVHLITLLSEAGQVGMGPDLLDHGVDLMLGQVGGSWRWQTGDSGQEASAVPREVLEDEGRDHRGHDTHQEVLKVSETKFLGHAQQPFNVLGIGGVPGELGLRSVLGDSSSQGLQGDHSHSVGGHQVSLTSEGVTIDHMRGCGGGGRGQGGG